VRDPEPTLRKLLSCWGNHGMKACWISPTGRTAMVQKPLRLEDERWSERNGEVRTTSIGVGHGPATALPFAIVRREGRDLLETFGYGRKGAAPEQRAFARPFSAVRHSNICGSTYAVSLLGRAVQSQQLDDESDTEQDAAHDHRRSFNGAGHRPQSEYPGEDDRNRTTVARTSPISCM